MHYSLIFEINSPETNPEDSESGTGSLPPSADSGLREMVAKALSEEASLPVDLDSLNFEPGTNTSSQVFFIIFLATLLQCDSRDGSVSLCYTPG